MFAFSPIYTHGHEIIKIFTPAYYELWSKHEEYITEFKVSTCPAS